VEDKIARLGLRESFRLTGVRSDVPRLLLGAMDMMLFPSLWEGLPLAVVEAQAAGLPCVVSQAVPDEAAVVPTLLRRLPLSEGPGLWAQAVLVALCARPRLSRLEALDHLERGPFNIRASVSHLEEIYQEQLREAA
jgi:glycosyltransferase involved in cell wall biosynthesis